jgi:acetyl-CoA C-acetyltransferase
MRNVAIAGCGMTRFGKREEGIYELATEAALNAMDDAEMDRVDAIVVGNFASGEFTGISGIANGLAADLNLIPCHAEKVENTSASGASAVKVGLAGILSGLYKSVLVVGVEKMTGIPGSKATSIIASLTHPEAEYPYGVTLTTFAGFGARLYMHKYGAPYECFAMIGVKNHKNGANNPYAHFQKVISLEKALQSPIIADPLRLYDICPISDGAAGLVLVGKDLIKKVEDPVYISGFGQATDTHAIHERPDPTTVEGLKIAAEQAFKMARKDRGDIDVAELHDAFTVLEIIQSEDIGFFKKGEGWRAVQEGVTEIDGDLPISPSGGLKARGHPVSATGVAQLVELTWQLRGEAGKRQVDGAEVGLSCNFAGFGNNSIVFIVER